MEVIGDRFGSPQAPSEKEIVSQKQIFIKISFRESVFLYVVGSQSVVVFKKWMPLKTLLGE
ncbi:MAG: hypothetical protein A2007_00085 [Verrucomicrobia bacterium GWC2_42_7]|nr:MAG: hypothetical protein A2007_00085 [Verrucomicrobia bacterium GWC2_42_7]